LDPFEKLFAGYQPKNTLIIAQTTKDNITGYDSMEIGQEMASLKTHWMSKKRVILLNIQLSMRKTD